MVTITVTDVDEAPAIAGDAAVPFAENRRQYRHRLGTTTMRTTRRRGVTTIPRLFVGWEPTAASSNSATWRTLTFKAPDSPDYETPGDANKDNVYEVTVQAKDGVGNIGMETVKVTVTNVEEDGTVTLSHLQPRVGVAITASVTDLDGDVSGVTWQWSRDSVATVGGTTLSTLKRPRRPPISR